MIRNWLTHKLYNKLYFVHDGSSWVLSEETKAIGTMVAGLGYNVDSLDDPLRIPEKFASIYFNCQFRGVRFLHKKEKKRVAIAYFHGLPGTEQLFTDCYSHLCNQKNKVDRIHVSHSEIKNCLLNGGFKEEQVFQIPIGININNFRPKTSELSTEKRMELGIPEDAFVVGSFQKDGNGWGEGLEPKFVKGPDVFLAVMKQLKSRIPNLYVLLSGPSRGFIKKGLEELGISYKHVFYDDYKKVCELYWGINCYLVASRQEGGPKAVLESMASRVPLVSTRVGQAMDLVEDEKSGFLADSEDIEGLVDRVCYVYENPGKLDRLLDHGITIAGENNYNAQIPLWENFLNGFVEK